jgi:CRISPR-associated protein Cmr5
VARCKKLGDEKAKTYGRETKRLPVRILTAGLGHALAFVKAKADDGKNALNRLHEDLTQWVLTERGLKGNAPKSLLESIVLGDSDFLRLATDEALAYLQWLNRFAEAEGLMEEQR